MGERVRPTILGCDGNITVAHREKDIHFRFVWRVAMKAGLHRTSLLWFHLASFWDDFRVHWNIVGVWWSMIKSEANAL
jgi:hypothetical protein